VNGRKRRLHTSHSHSATLACGLTPSEQAANYQRTGTALSQQTA
jgi:hypothetical protein